MKCVELSFEWKYQMSGEKMNLAQKFKNPSKMHIYSFKICCMLIIPSIYLKVTLGGGLIPFTCFCFVHIIKDSFAFVMISLSFNRVHNNVRDSMGRKKMSANSFKGFCCQGLLLSRFLEHEW